MMIRSRSLNSLKILEITILSSIGHTHFQRILNAFFHIGELYFVAENNVNKQRLVYPI